MSVVALEAGRWWRPDRDFATDEEAQAPLFWLDERLSGGSDPLAFGANNSGTGVGGSTLHFTAFTPRAQADDFRLRSEFGVAVDWPFGIEELEPYYDELERFLGVAGPADYPWGPARGPYPLPAHAINGAGQLMERGCDGAGHPHLAGAERGPYRPSDGRRLRRTRRLHQSGLLPGRLQHRRQGLDRCDLHPGGGDGGGRDPRRRLRHPPRTGA